MSLGQYDFVFSCVALHRRHEADSTVAVLIVVPLDEAGEWWPTLLKGLPKLTALS